MRWLLIPFVAVLFGSCSSVTSIQESQLDPGYYSIADQVPGKRPEFKKVYVDVEGDSLKIMKMDGSKSLIRNTNNQIFKSNAFDFDVLTVLFKYRPSASNFPHQLMAEFNGNLFVGHRFDRYKTHFVETPTRVLRKMKHRAITAGVFGGMGTSFISPWTTNYQTTDEYSGFILSKGISIMMGLNNLTVGIGVGWDNLVDRDKSIWIYQDKAWYGLTLSLNLN